MLVMAAQIRGSVAEAAEVEEVEEVEEIRGGSSTGPGEASRNLWSGLVV
jgi:hypothetical protein